MQRAIFDRIDCESGEEPRLLTPGRRRLSLRRPSAKRAVLPPTPTPTPTVLPSLLPRRRLRPAQPRLGGHGGPVKSSVQQPYPGLLRDQDDILTHAHRISIAHDAGIAC